MKNILILLIFVTFGFTKSFAQSSTFIKTIQVSVSNRVALLDAENQPLKAGNLYRVKLSTMSTGIRTGAEYLVWFSNTDVSWKVRMVTSNGTNSNHPQLEVDSNIVRLYTNHETAYPIKVYAEVFNSGNGYTQPSMFGSSFQWQRLVNNTYYMDGNVGIGTNAPGEKLSVNGKIRAHEIKVESTASTWPDYVFEEEYDLPSLKSTADFIKANKHLPGVPTANDVEKDGISLGEMNKILLQKIEELTLHMIEMKSEIEELKNTHK
ncbi:hypothetical protein [Sphingobacterium anhuiense]|uniref:DUF4468 domain-containing protein n=1 Tax=Sphingobacterium anhuiense TaxID=493780 RepID=A0ABW5YVC7_9SPHI